MKYNKNFKHLKWPIVCICLLAVEDIFFKCFISLPLASATQYYRTLCPVLDTDMPPACSVQNPDKLEQVQWRDIGGWSTWSVRLVLPG